MNLHENRVVRFVVALLVATVLSGVALADARLRGTVTDPEGKPVAEVLIKVIPGIGPKTREKISQRTPHFLATRKWPSS